MYFALLYLKPKAEYKIGSTMYFIIFNSKIPGTEMFSIFRNILYKDA